MKNKFFILLLSISTNFSYGQQPIMGIRGYNQFNIAPNGFVNSFSPAPEEKSTNVYLYDNWRIGNVYLKDSTKLTNLNVKIDLIDKVLDIQYNGMVKVLPFRKLLALSFQADDGGNEIYVSGDAIFGKTHPFYDRLFHVLHEGEVSLYSRSYTQTIETNTNAALAIDIEDKVVIKKSYVIIYQQNIVDVHRKSDLKKDLKRIFGDEATSYLKKMNPRKEADLLVLVDKLEDFTKQ